MREIKFRAWDTAKKIMYSAGELGKDELCLNPDGRGFVNVSSADQRFSQYMRHIVPLQYTGLKDKNGKEIYEGDIIQFPEIIPLTVGYEKGSFVWGNLAPFITIREKLEEMPGKVIGNIYENPELIGGNNGKV